MQRISVSTLPLLLLIAGACDPESDDHDAAAAGVEATEDAGRSAPAKRLVREVRLSDTHAIRFWALAGGGGLVEETLHADLDGASALPQDEGRRTLAELHGIVAPNEPVPAELLEIDELAALQPVDEDEVEAEDEADVSGPAGPDTVTAPEQAPTAACTAWDWNGDRQWFIDNFCNLNTHRDCVANYGAINSWRYKTTKLNVSVFNQSFEAPAQFTGGHRNCWTTWYLATKCEWIVDFNDPIPNRTVSNYWWTSGGNGNYHYADIAGSGPCARVGMAQMWNVASGGGNPPPPPNPNPAGACNYVGEACCSNQTLADFYCDQTHDAFLYCNGGACQH